MSSCLEGVRTYNNNEVVIAVLPPIAVPADASFHALSSIVDAAPEHTATGVLIIVHNYGADPIDQVKIEADDDPALNNPLVVVSAAAIPAGQQARFGGGAIPSPKYGRVSVQSTAGTSASCEFRRMDD